MQNATDDPHVACRALPVMVVGGLSQLEADVLGADNYSQGYLETATLYGGIDRAGPRRHVAEVLGLTTGDCTVHEVESRCMVAVCCCVGCEGEQASQTWAESSRPVSALSPIGHVQACEVVVVCGLWPR